MNFQERFKGNFASIGSKKNAAAALGNPIEKAIKPVQIHHDQQASPLLTTGNSVVAPTHHKGIHPSHPAGLFHDPGFYHKLTELNIFPKPGPLKPAVRKNHGGDLSPALPASSHSKHSVQSLPLGEARHQGKRSHSSRPEDSKTPQQSLDITKRREEDTQSEYQGLRAAGKRNISYTPYTLQDYKKIMPTGYYQLGGLGAARIGSEEWKKGVQQIRRRMEYGSKLRALHLSTEDNSPQIFLRQNHCRSFSES